MLKKLKKQIFLGGIEIFSYICIMKTKIIKRIYYDIYEDTYVNKYSLIGENDGIEITLSSASVFKEKEPIIPNQKSLYFCNFSTSSRFRNKGFGTMLLKEIIKRYKGKYNIIHLDACPSLSVGNAPQLGKRQLIGFYQSLGFEVYERKREYTTMILDFNKK
jgi:ribosomal protein S18 acetylase RimI-like enzyme